MKRRLLTTAILTPLALASCGQEPGTPETAVESSAAAPLQDIAAGQPDQVTVAFENDYLRVMRFDLDPNEALPPHRGKRRVVYSLTDYELDWTEEGQPSGRRSWTAGDVHAHSAGIHAVENTGDTTASFLVFERLDAPLPSASMHEDDAELPAGARSLLSNADFHVLEVALQPGDSQEPHAGGWRAIYSLTDYSIEWREGDEVEQKSWNAGDVHWHEPSQHAAGNTGTTPARWLVVGLKQ
jgi:quercetin dioxygenase-like cupin family protein